MVKINQMKHTKNIAILIVILLITVNFCSFSEFAF